MNGLGYQPPAILLSGALLALCANWLIAIFHPYAAELFPTRIRAQAVGFTFSWSRISSMFVGYAVTVLLAWRGPEAVFTMIAIAMLAITFHVDFAFAGVASVPLASFAGSVGALGIVYALASARRRGLSTIVLLLAGVTMTAFFQALILFTQYIADFADTFRTVRWLMGTLDVGSYAPADLARLTHDLHKHGRALVFVRREESLRDLMNALPDHLEVEVLGHEDDFVVAALVRPRARISNTCPSSTSTTIAAADSKYCWCSTPSGNSPGATVAATL